MQNDLDVFFNNVMEEANNAPLPDSYVAKYLEGFVRILYDDCPEVREIIAIINNQVDNPDR
jgi:hypothetical protein